MATWNKDFSELFQILNSKQVGYLVIGGVAYNYYAPPRATKDVDVWIDHDLDNLERLRSSLTAFGFPAVQFDADAFAASQTVLMLGRVPQRIDLLSHPKGGDWARASSTAVTAHYGQVPVRVVAIDELIALKRAAARPRDLADILVLENAARDSSEE